MDQDDSYSPPGTHEGTLIAPASSAALQPLYVGNALQTKRSTLRVIAYAILAWIFLVTLAPLLLPLGLETLLVVQFVFTIALIFVVARATPPYSANRVTKIIMDGSGVYHGARFWPWHRIESVRMARVRGGFTIIIWPDRHTGPGRELPIDPLLTQAEADELVERLTAFAHERGIQFQCGECFRFRRLPTLLSGIR